MKKTTQVKNNRLTSKIVTRLTLILAVISMTLLTGCHSSSDKITSLQTYQEQMDSFFEKTDSLSRQIGSLDPSDADSEKQFLDLIDQLADACKEAAETDTPSEYERAGSLCRSADESMQQAKELYHSAFESTPFNEADFNNAQEQYQSAVETLKELVNYFQSYS